MLVAVALVIAMVVVVAAVAVMAALGASWFYHECAKQTEIIL